MCIRDSLHRLDIHYWKALVSNGIPGVEIVASPLALASKLRPTEEQVRHVLAFVKPHYDWTLVDLGRSLSPICMAALEECDEACLVTTLEVPALHLAKPVSYTHLTDLDLDAGMVGFITKTSSVYSILDAITNLHRLDIHYWNCLLYTSRCV